MRKIIAVLLSIMLLFTACGGKKGEFYTRDIYAMDTVISISVPNGTKDVSDLTDRAVAYINTIEYATSAHRNDSELSRLNSTSGSYSASTELAEVMDKAIRIASDTDGAYDPTCLPIAGLWNIKEGGPVPAPSAIEYTLPFVNYKELAIQGNSVIKKSAVSVDLGGIAKGYALEKTVNILKENAEYGMVSFGGNVAVWGQKPDGSSWEIGIKDPYDTESVVGKIKVDDGYVSVSGDYERFFEQDGVRYHHIFDPATGYPVNNGVHSVAVYTRDGALGDALSTALFVMGYEKAIEYYEKTDYEFEALFVTEEGIFMTEGMKGMFVNEN